MSAQAGMVANTWYWLGWRARIIRDSGEVAIEQTLLAIENVLESDDRVHQRPQARRITTDSVRFELWIVASTEEVAIRNARVLLRWAVRQCGVGDPLLEHDTGKLLLSLMFEEWPKVRRPDRNARA